MKKVIMSVCTAVMCCTMMYAADAVKYVKVTDVLKLQTGDKVLMACSSTAINGKKPSSTGKFLDGIKEGFSLSNDTLTVTNNVGEITLGTVSTGTDEEGATIITTTLTVDGVLLKVVKDGTDLSTNSSATKDFTIAIDKMGDAVITNLGSKKPYFRYNGSSNCFRPYTSTTMAKIQLYKLVSGDPSVHVESVTLTPSTANMVVGDELSLTAMVLPTNAGNQDLTWSSDDKTVATVASNGVVSAIAAGKATITATSVDGGKKGTCVITVKSATETTKMYPITNKAKQLVAGALVSFHQQEDVTKAMGTYSTGNNIPAISATNNEDGTLNVTVKGLYTAHVSGDDYAFEGSDGKYIYAAGGSSNNYLKSQTDAYYWTVTIGDDGAFTVQSTTNTSRGMLLYNPGSNLFSCYAKLSTSVRSIVLYSSIPAEDTPTGVVNVNENVNVYKVLRNGRIMIVRDGVEYDVMGNSRSATRSQVESRK